MRKSLLSPVCLLIAYSSNSPAKKFCWLRNIYYCLCDWKFPWWKGENLSFIVTSMRKQLLVCLQLEQILPFLKTNERFFRCRCTRFFYKQHFISNVRLKLPKNQVKPKQHPEVELLANMSKKQIFFNEIIRLIVMKMKIIMKKNRSH